MISFLYLEIIITNSYEIYPVHKLKIMMQENLLDNVRIVLVATTHPGNIGASARAMKTMGIRQLDLVRPRVFPSAEVTALAAGADDVLSRTRVHENLQSAIGECNYVLGSSARTRNISWPVISPGQAARRILELVTGNDARVAVLFGRESAGLSNDEIELCNAVIEIPTSPVFSSLNLAAAVQIICYELRKTVMENDNEAPVETVEVPPASAEQMTMLYDHMQQYLTEIDYFDPDKPRLLMRRLKRMFNRCGIDLNEYNILRGILTAGQKAAKDK